jgi:DNA recombination protein RmuC
MYDVTPPQLTVALLATAALAFALGWFVSQSRSRSPSLGADPAAAPLAAALAAVEAQLRSTERERAAGQAALATEVGLMRSSAEQLRRETASLSTALRSPQVRGRWGETQLRRVLELGGALEHCDFVEQQVLDGGVSDGLCKSF